MFKSFINILTILFIFIAPSIAETFKNIEIKGNKRISDKSVLMFSDVPESKIVDENSLNTILKNLYNTGFFDDVEINVINNNLVIKVSENPIIQSVSIEGIKSKKTKKKINDVIILKDRSSFNINSAKKDKISILNLFKGLGYYFTKIDTSIEDIGDNKINLIYNIEKGKKSKINNILFTGNKIFKDSKLKGVIISEEYRFWKIISGKKYLREDIIKFDENLLSNFYKNEGYFNVKIETSFANYIGDDKFELVYNIDAGKKYFFNNLSLALPTDYNIDNFKKLTKLFDELKGSKYSLNAINKILKEIDKITLIEQYEFLTASVTESINDNLIDFIFNVSESDKFYVERINIFGNNITQENVIRNHFTVDEGDAFNELLHKKTINNLKGLNYFSKVRSKIIEGSTPQQKIINISLDEKPTGEIMAGAGIGTDGGSFTFAVNENNFLGRGLALGTNFTVGSETLRGAFSINNPNYQGSNRSLNFSAESSVTDRLSNFGYKSSKTGASVASGFELYDDFFLTTGVSTYVEELKTDSSASSNQKKQKGSYFDGYVNYTLDYDRRDQKFQTRDGYRSRFTQNVPVISENFALKNTYDFKVYNEWLNENIATLGLFLRSAHSITGKDVKLSDRLFLPATKLRGFERGKIGPRDGSDYIGGNYAVAVNLATTVPQILPNSQSTDFSIFLDTANVWGVDYDSGLADGKGSLRSSIGVAFNYYSMIGPVSFSLTEVISKGKHDVPEFFRFNLGTTF
jgi:outer membrane protein insertion porin family